jgi:hypothetical protein
VLGGLGVVAISLVPGWVVHIRHQGGHGLTEIATVWNAWQGRAWPFLPLAVATAGLVGVLATLAVIGAVRTPPLVLAAGSVLVLALFLAQLYPLDRTGYASRVVITPAWPVSVGIGLALAMSVSALGLGGWGKRALTAAGLAVVLLGVAGVGGRMLALNLAEGDPRSYVTGTYLRAGASGQPAMTMEIGDDAYRVGDRWSGTFEGRGLVVVLTDDPACPSDRGSYRVFPVGETGIRWNTIVDLCADGARARDLTTGAWEPAN